MAEPTTNPFKNYFYMKSDWSRLLKGPSVKAHLVLGTAMVCSAALILKAASNPSDEAKTASRYYQHKLALKEGRDPFRIYRVIAQNERK